MQLNEANKRRQCSEREGQEGVENNVELSTLIDRLRRDVREKDYLIKRKEIEFNFKVKISVSA